MQRRSSSIGSDDRGGSGSSSGRNSIDTSSGSCRFLRHRERWSEAEVLKVFWTVAAAHGCRVRVQGKRSGQEVDPMVEVVVVVIVRLMLSCRDVTCNMR